MQRLELAGRRFGKLVALKKAPSRTVGKVTHSFWLCQCDCGEICNVETQKLRGAHTRSCGCLPKRYRHGHASEGHSSEYSSWAAAKQRCENSNNNSWKNYGGRGIRMCARWSADFVAFLTDMGPKPQATSLDRHPNPDGNYEPGNCRWTSSKQQARNKRDNVFITHDGERLCVMDWAKRLGVSHTCITYRIRRGLNPEQILKR